MGCAAGTATTALAVSCEATANTGTPWYAPSRVPGGTISGKIAKDLFEIVWNEGGDPRAIVDDRGMKQVTDTGAIEKAVDDVIAANPDKVEQAKAKPTMAGWFVGQVMKATGGKANPQVVNDLVKAKLGLE